MFLSIRYKLSLFISILLLASIGASGYFLIDQKRTEIKGDIWQSALSFAELSTEPLLKDYNQYFTSQAFLYFERELNNFFLLNQDVSRIRFVSFSGEVLYDSEQKVSEQKKYQLDAEMQKIVRDIKPILKTDERTVYLKREQDGKKSFTDAQEHSIAPIGKQERVQEIIYPSSDNKLRIIYSLSYHSLEERTLEAIRMIAIILLIVAVLGIACAFIFGRRLTKPLLTLTGGVKKIAAGDLETQVKIQTHDETRILADAFNSMAADLKKSTEVKLAHERVSKELEIARKIQGGLLPKESPKIEGLEIAVDMLTASEVGGDCYDFLKLSDGSYFFYIGDATGHGVPASLVVALTSATMHAGALNSADPKTILDHANLTIKAKTEPNMFMTLVGCHFDPVKKNLKFVQAGHEQIFLYRHKEKRVETLSKGGMALGMLPDISKLTKSAEVNWEKGDLLFLYTDGIPEACKNEKEKLGMEAFGKMIEKYAHGHSAKSILENILKDVREYMGDYPQADDITLMAVRKSQ